jgi:hypothetical protein
MQKKTSVSVTLVRFEAYPIAAACENRSCERMDVYRRVAWSPRWFRQGSCPMIRLRVRRSSLRFAPLRWLAYCSVIDQNKLSRVRWLGIS